MDGVNLKQVTTPIKDAFSRSGSAAAGEARFVSERARGENFSQSYMTAIYQSGAYSLNHPNVKTDEIALYYDYLA